MKKSVVFWVVLAVVLVGGLLFFGIKYTVQQVSFSPNDDQLTNYSISYSGPTNENVLCVYNNNSEISREICEYYLSKRPGAYSLGLDIPDEAFSDSNRERMDDLDNFKNYVKSPLDQWVANHPELNITHLAIAKDLPITTNSLSAQGYFSVDPSFIDNVLNWYGYYPKNMYGGLAISSAQVMRRHFNPFDSSTDYYHKIRFVTSYLTGYTLEDIKVMIDKGTSSDYISSQKVFLLDRDADGFSVAGGLLGHIEPARFKLLSVGIPGENVILEETDLPISISGEVVAYLGPGSYHNGYGGECWVTSEDNFDFSVSNKSIMTSYESWNALTFTGEPCPNHPNTGQGLIADVFSPNAFGGQSYSRSFSGAMGHVNEPGLNAVNIVSLTFSSYASGLTLAESAQIGWTTMGWRGITVGDPLMKLRENYLIGNVSGEQCADDSDCADNLYCNGDIYDIKRCHVDQEKCILDVDGSIIENEAYRCTGERDLSTNWPLSRRQCLNGEWLEEISCGAESICLENSAECKKKSGQYCNYTEECAGICSLDINGIGRCHFSSAGCVLNDSKGLETSPNNFACYDDNSTRFCYYNGVNSSWQDGKQCVIGCSDGFCIEDFFNYPAEFRLLKSGYYFINVGVNPISNNISSLFNGTNFSNSDFQMIAFRLSLWRNQTWEIYSYSEKLKKWVSTSPGATWLVSPGEGMLVEAVGGDYNLTIQGENLSSPVAINLEGVTSLIAIPFCAEKYTASKLLNLLHGIDPQCVRIRHGYLQKRGPLTWWDWNYSNEYYLGGQRKDFQILPFASYWVDCGANTSFIFKPACINESNTEKRLDEVEVSYNHNATTAYLNQTRLFTINNSDLTEDNSFSVITNNAIGIGSGRGYVIIRNLSIGENETKTIYVQRKSEDSNAVCVNDNDGLNTSEEILANCTIVLCPGNKGGYQCSIEDNMFAVSGLRHSGVIEYYVSSGTEIPSEPGNNNNGGGGSNSIDKKSENQSDTGNKTQIYESSNDTTDSNRVNDSNGVVMSNHLIILIYISTGLFVVILVVIIILSILKKSCKNRQIHQN